jgi:hypothetical protein
MIVLYKSLFLQNVRVLCAKLIKRGVTQLEASQHNVLRCAQSNQ